MYEAAVDEAVVARRRKRRQKDYYWNPALWAKERAGIFLWSGQRDIATSVVDNHDVAVKAGHGVGKALSLDTPLPTPQGWTTMGEVSVGDFLLDEQGNPTQVTALSPVWREDTYRVWFDDATYVDTAAQHEWNVLDLAARTQEMKSGVQDWRDRWSDTVVRETQELFLTQKTGAGQSRWRVPAAKALQIPEAPLLVDPYVLGAWLGDGSSRVAQMTTHPDDYEILSKFEAAGYSLRKLDAEYRWSFADNGVFVSSIRTLGIWNNKHIPEGYLRSSVEQRRELLRGILDTDGHIDRRGIITIDLMNDRLAEDVVELVRSLGGRATIKPRRAVLGGRDVGVRWRMSIKVLDFNPFFLSRKAARWSVPSGQASRVTVRTITRVERVETVPTKCVTVSGPSHLFLAGPGMVPTHNSLLAAVLICWWIDTRWPHGRVASTAPSAHQIGAIVWYEVREIYAQVAKRYRDGLTHAPLPGYITGENEWKTPDGQKVGMGRKPPDHKTDDAFQGIHAREGGVLAIGDEAVGLTAEMIDALGNITSNEESRRFLIMNPTNPASYAGKLFKEQPDNWTFHTISVFDNPNFTGEEVPEQLRKALSDQSYVDGKKAEYGEGTPRYLSRVLGEFAFDNDFSLIVTEDMATGHDLEIPETGQRPILGVDVARYGDDKSVVYSNDGGRVRFVDSWGKTDGMTTAEKIHEYAMGLSASEVRIDSTGVGGPILDRVVQLRNEDDAADYDVVAMVGSAASPNKTQHWNARAWWYDRFRYGLQEGFIDLDPLDTHLTDELMGIQYKFAAGSSALLIESKDDMRRRGVKSPDLADAAIYAGADLSYLDTPEPGKTTVNPSEIEDVMYGSAELDALDW